MVFTLTCVKGWRDSPCKPESFVFRKVDEYLAASGTIIQSLPEQVVKKPRGTGGWSTQQWVTLKSPLNRYLEAWFQRLDMPENLDISSISRYCLLLKKEVQWQDDQDTATRFSERCINIVLMSLERSPQPQKRWPWLENRWSGEARVRISAFKSYFIRRFGCFSLYIML